MKYLFFTLGIIAFVLVFQPRVFMSGSKHLTARTHQPTNPIIFQETFEGDTPFSEARNLEIGDWDYALQYVNDPVFQGNRAARFEIRKDQPLIHNGKRAEAVIVKGANGQIGREAWYSFAVYFPSDGFEKDSQRDLICQWYQDGSPATSLRVSKDRLLLESGPAKDSRERMAIGDLKKDQWQTFVFHFIHSHSNDGLIEVWHNGTKVITQKGGNMYDDVLPKWKIGLYKSAFKHDTSEVDSRVIYYDDIRVGNERAALEDMMPESESTTVSR